MQWSDVVAQVHEISARFRADGSPPWFRGERDASWVLKSTIHRHVEQWFEGLARPMPDADRREQLIENAKAIYRRFKADAWPLLRGRERSEWGVLFAMQHFGLPTRLLDWTESFACATFFAHHHRKREDAAAIWVLDPQALNKLSIDEDVLLAIDNETVDPRINVRAWHPQWKPPEEPLSSVAATPIFTNPRMVSQRSAFVLTGDLFEPLDQQHGGALGRAGQLIKIVLAPDTYEDVDAYLSLAGLNAYSFYPDLEGIALKHKAQTDRQIRDARRFYPDAFS